MRKFFGAVVPLCLAVWLLVALAPFTTARADDEKGNGIMSQVLSNKPYSGQQELVTGFRILASEPAAGGKTGLRFIGNILSPSVESKADFAEVFNTATGFETLVRKIPVKYASTIKFGINDLFARNYERYFLGTDLTAVAANPTATSGPDIVIAGKIGDQHGLMEGRLTDAQRTALKVYNVTGTALLVLNTDYKLVQIYGWTFVEMLVDTYAGNVLRLGTTADASVAYGFQLLAHYKINPITRAERTCQVILQAPSKSGGSWEYVLRKADLVPDGSFDLASKDASQMKFQLVALDDSAANPTEPYGYVRHYGPDDQGVSLI